MVDIIGVRFRENGKIYYFNPGNAELQAGDHVIVETIRGVEYGLVALGRRSMQETEIVNSLKPIIRVANDKDAETYQDNIRLSKDAFGICQKKIAKHKLEMKLIEAEYTFDKNKLIFYFSADGRIDFRELVRDLATEFHTRIELRQIGVRDEARLLGGLGICGRMLCCNTFLSEFGGVTIKMAKEQNLAMTPSKISGVCGRLMCCLKNEEAAYEYLNSKMPAVNDVVITPNGEEGTVRNINVLRQSVRVVIKKGEEDFEIEEYKVDELKFTPRKRKKKNFNNQDGNGGNQGGNGNAGGNKGGNNSGSQGTANNGADGDAASDAELKALEEEDRKFGIED